MFAREINIKQTEIPNDWSIEAADLIVKVRIQYGFKININFLILFHFPLQLLKRRPKDRLGFKNGIIDIKEHAWFRNVNWVELYRKELKAPFNPRPGDNFDTNYCNRVDEVDYKTYDYYLNKVNSEKHFIDFYYNEQDSNKDTTMFEYEGKEFKFSNIHEEKYEKALDNTSRMMDKEKVEHKKSMNLTSLASTNIPNFGKSESSLSVKPDLKSELHTGNVSPISHRKMNY